MPKIDLESIEQITKTTYPAPFAAAMGKRHSRRIGAVFDLADFGVNHVVLEPGGISSQRHWHEDEDEFVAMLDGEAVLIEEGGESAMRAGDCAVFLKGVADGHHLVNRSDSPCTFIAIGKAAVSDCHYPDIDLRLDAASGAFTHKDGSPYKG